MSKRVDNMETLGHDSLDDDGPQFDQEDLILIGEARQDPNKVLTTRPIPLGYVSVACIIANRMIGKVPRRIRTPD
jgi:hypothetical protein